MTNTIIAGTIKYIALTTIQIYKGAELSEDEY
jgi:hypothetical protein